MATLKTLLTFLLAGAFFGLAGASWLGPKWLKWDNTPRLTSAQAICDLPTIVQDVTAQLLLMQLYGTLLGALVFFVLGIFFVRARNKRTPPAAPTPRPAV
jgi:ABC-type phosphate/phosphonate transport system permease subunit